MKQIKKGIDMERTFKEGLGGGILGAFIGAPGLGMAIGVMHANKDKLKEFAKNADEGMGTYQYNQKAKKKMNVRDDPAAYF